MSERVVVPDCHSPDDWHKPPGPRPAAYKYRYRDSYTGLDGLLMVLCPECCARMRFLAEHPEPGIFAPAPTRIGVLLDANTLERVI